MLTPDEADGGELDDAIGGLPPSDGADFGNEIETARTKLLADILDPYFENLERFEPPVTWPIGEGWGRLALRPHSVIVIGGPTGVGKTALCGTLLVQAMQFTPDLRVLVANNESTVPELVDTLVARIGSIDLRDVQNRDRSRVPLEKLANAKDTMRAIAQRLEFMEMPFTLEQVIERAGEFRADVVFIDTLQKMRLGEYDGEIGEAVRRIMHMLRDLAYRGHCVVAAAQISREGVKHLQYRIGSKIRDDRDASVFLHGSEIESCCNHAFLLACEPGAAAQQGIDEEYKPVPMWLQHVKGRNTLQENIPLLFDGRYQRFSPRSIRKKTAVDRRRVGDESVSRGSGAISGTPDSDRQQIGMNNAMPEGEEDDGTEWLT